MENKYFNQDCIIGARKYLKDNSVDLIITDPPYGINGDKLDKHYNRDESNVLKGYHEISTKDYPKFSSEWINEAYRVLKPGGTIYIVSGYTQLRHILNALSNTKLIEQNHIIWKYNFGVYTSRKFVSSHYHILYYIKPGAKHTFNTFAFYSDSEKNDKGGSLNYLDREDVWIINREYKPGEIKNKNELPQSLLLKMIMYSSNPGDLVCDFFLGGFSTAKTAIGLGRQACGFEINKTAFNYNIKKLKQIKSKELLSKLRKVPSVANINKGKPLTNAERNKIYKEYNLLKKQNITKKESIEIISKNTGRGYWSILRIIGHISNNK